MEKASNPALVEIAAQEQREANRKQREAEQLVLKRTEAAAHLRTSLASIATSLDEEIAEKAREDLGTYKIWSGQAQIAKNRMRDNNLERSITTPIINAAWQTWPDDSWDGMINVIQEYIVIRYEGKVVVITEQSKTCPELSLSWRREPASS